MRLVGGLLRPYRGGWLTIVLLALLVETAMSLAAPWPLKVILRSAGFSGGKVHRLLEEGSMNTLRKYKHAILLAALVCVAFIESFSHREVLGPVLSDLVIVAMMLLVFLIVFERRVNRLVAFIALATAVVAGWARYLLPSSAELWLRLIYHSAALLLTGFAALVILRNIFEQRVVRADDVLGAVCGYLLAAGARSNLFMVIEIFLPGSFSVGPGFWRRARHLGRAEPC